MSWRFAGGHRCGAALMLVAGMLLFSLWPNPTARAQSGALSAKFNEQVYPAGWNLIAFGGAGSASSGAPGDSLYTFQPGDQGYEATDAAHLVPGYGYWVYVPSTVALSNSFPSLYTYSVAVTAGQCVLVGNPSMLASAVVKGAQRIYEFSPALNGYIETATIGAGRGAWACNDTRSATVTVTAAVPAKKAFVRPSLQTASPGRVRITLLNVSHGPLVFGVRQMDATGDPAGDLNAAEAGTIPGCDACPEHVDPKKGGDICTAKTTPSRIIMLPPGAYLLHLQFEQPAVPDLITTFTAAANTAYIACYS